MKPQFLLPATMLAGWFSRRQQAVIEYLQEENRVLREHCQRAGRLRFTDDQRARLARKGKAVPWAALKEAVTLVTPQTILRWHRELIARKYDGLPIPDSLRTILGIPGAWLVAGLVGGGLAADIDGPNVRLGRDRHLPGSAR